MIRSVLDRDVTSIAEIYNHYISNTVVTFETETISPENILSRISKIQSDNLPWLIAEDDMGKVIGYAYASKWRERFAYRFSVEVTVYLSPNSSGNGVGTQLYEALFSELKQRSIHSVIGGITLPNQASVALHEKFGLEKVAHFKEVGFKFDQWQDVGYWQGTIKA
ncbi:arsinothricin resistance N-acetyltransferase ArsN1 family B [Thalassotalea sp. PLHSN55]|uniref:arsinothricin resistance N-acetyltransferase ArsN1 family B n=1 Tax=Thalassotalea sp. PLHSN55 TaxID=3435888 RepID=UPI003F844F87